MKEMTNEEKAKQIAKDYPMPPTAITESDVRVMMENTALQMSDWKDAQYKVLIDFIVNFINDGAYDCEIFSECMSEWCAENCGSHNPNFNAECLKNWIKIQNESF